MLIAFLISLLCYKGSCHINPFESQIDSKELVKCITDIVSEYFAPQKVLTYVGNKQDNDEFLTEIHKLNIVTIVSSQKMPVPHEGYIIAASNSYFFIKNFSDLTKGITWNPEARFLIIVRSLEYHQLEYIFNMLLKMHVDNVVVVNATSDAHLYTYNAFDNYGCGKRYDEIISYGKCSKAHSQDLYPNKYVTKLKNCTFDVPIPHWPPYTIFPPINNDTSLPLSYGIEPYFLGLLGEIQGFTLNVVLYKDYNSAYTTVSADMKAAGPLQMLQNNEADVMLGGLLLVPSRAIAFNYVFNFLPYVDEIRFVVKHASYVPPWKNIYLEFTASVWMLIVLSLVFYSVILIILLRVEDKSLLVLKLLGTMVLQGSNVPCHSTVKCIFIIWIWFVYLINTFYQSSFFSLTTNPAMESQISTEADIKHHNLKPCFSQFMKKYYIESTHLNNNTGNITKVDTYIPGCEKMAESLKSVMKSSNELYTIALHEIYMYTRHEYLDEYGNPYIYLLQTPYSKVIYSLYFYKGFPLIHDIRLSALRIREMGLVDKAIEDIKHSNIIKHYYHAKSFGSRFVMPWYVYIFGCGIATITFAFEKLSKHK